MIKFIRNLIERLAGRRLFRHSELCRSCWNLKSVSNFSPCYGCKCNDRYEK